MPWRGCSLAFEQADNSLTRKHGGSGLGLAVTKRLAEQMGAKRAQSIPGEGSVFWFTARLRIGSTVASMPRTRSIVHPVPKQGSRLRSQGRGCWWWKTSR